MIPILHKKGQNKIWTEFSSLGQEPTFKAQKMKKMNPDEAAHNEPPHLFALKFLNSHNDTT